MGRAVRAKAKRYEKENKPEIAKAWKMTITEWEWVELWLAAGSVLRRNGQTVPAWMARGIDKNEDVQLERHEPDQPFSLGNVRIVYKGMVLVDGKSLINKDC